MTLPGDERDAPRDRPAVPERHGAGDLLRTRGRVIAGTVFFVLYALTFGVRGHVAAGLIGGVLGGLLFFLLLREAEHRRRKR